MASSPSRPLSFLGGPSSPSTGTLYPHQDLSIPTPGPLYPHQELSISIPRLGLVGSQKPLKSLLGQVLLPKGPAADSTHPDWTPWLLITQPPSGRLLSKCVTPNSYQGFSCTPIHPPRLSPGYLNLVDAGFGIPGGPLSPKPLCPSSEMKQVKTYTSYPHASDQFL